MANKNDTAPPNESQKAFRAYLEKRNKSPRTIEAYTYWHMKMVKENLETDPKGFLNNHPHPPVRAMLMTLWKSRGENLVIESIPYERKEIPSYLEQHIEDRVVQSMHIQRHRILMWLLTETGLRITEALTIKLNDIKMNEVPPRILITGKGKHQAFIYPGEELIKELILLKRPEESQWIFTSPKFPDRHLTPNALRYQLKKVNSDLHPHIFRHTYAKKNLDTGVNLSTIQRLLRHKNINTTGVYLKIKDQEVQEASKKTWRKRTW